MNDYEKVLKEHGVTQETVDCMMTTLGKGGPLGDRYKHIIPVFSKIEGIGITNKVWLGCLPLEQLTAFKNDVAQAIQEERNRKEG